MIDLTGARLGSYEVKERLGAGGMAVVYRAIQQPLGREVALKALMPNLISDEGFLKRFEHEARTLARLDHPHILPIFDFVVTPEVVFLTMPLVRGGSLRDVLDRGPLDGATAWRYLREVGEGLQHAHDAGIVHRDLKPGNVLMHADGRALLADFGLARSATTQDQRLTTAGFTIGTPGYMAPEQVYGHDIDHRADIYAMGVMTFEMMTGQMPFKGATAVEVAIASVSNPIPSAAAINPRLPDELDAVLRLAMAKEPAQRPQSIRELVGLLARVPQYRSAVVAVPVAVAAAPSAPVYVAPPPAPAAGPSPTITILEQMGLRRLEPVSDTYAGWYVAAATAGAQEAAGPKWPMIATGASTLAALTTNFENAFGAEAVARLREWGRHTTENGLAARKASSREQRAIKLVPSRKRLSILLNAYLESLDGARGGPAHASRQIDADRWWVVHFANPFAAGRRKPEKSCHYWIACYEAMLRWAGLANDWLVDEIECGTVTGTGDCVFALRASST